MKIALFCLVIFTAWLNLACEKNVESSPSVAANEKSTETPQAPQPQTTPTPDKYPEFDIIEQFASYRNKDLPTSLEYKGYKIKKVAVKKRDESDSPEAAIDDLVVSRNGRAIHRFEGIYNPLGNKLGYGFYRFLKGSEEQLFIVDESNRYDREWIVSLSPNFEVLFDSGDYNVESGYLRVTDINNDGEKEITLGIFCGLGFGSVMSDRPWRRIIFKYDAATRKYLPASHIFTDYTLTGQDERIQKFRGNSPALNGGKFSELLEILTTYIYAGRENEAWRFFDENFSDRFISDGAEKEKSETRAKIKAKLNKDPIYKFIQQDLQKRKQKSAAN
jgi:hypothetical protein